jgi:hypothetical protein
MPKSALPELKRHKHIDAVIRRELRRDEWVAVDAVLLICGIAPPPNCVAVPDAAAKLLDETIFATDYQLKLARYVLDLWLDENPDHCPTATDCVWREVFIGWARRRVGGDDGPELLEHFHQRLSPRPKGALPLYLSSDGLRRLEQLEDLAQPPPQRYGVSRGSGRPSGITGWLKKAWNALGKSSERSPESIMDKLADMLAEEVCLPIVRVVESEGIVYTRPDGEVDLYSRDTVKRWVNRERKKLAKTVAADERLSA